MPRRLFVLRIPDGSILHGVSCILDHHSSTTKPTTPLPSCSFGMLAFIKQGLSSNWTILPLSTAQPTGEHGSPSVFDLFFTFLLLHKQLSRSLNGAASVLGLVSVFTAILTLFFSCILIVFTCLLCHQSATTTTYHLRACRSLCIRRRCSLSSPSQFSRQPKPQFHHRHRHRASLKHTNPSQPFKILLLISTVPPSPTTSGRLSFFRLCATYNDPFSSELRNPSDCRRDQ